MATEYYIMPDGSFPVQGVNDDPVLITRAEFEDCCCEIWWVTGDECEYENAPKPYYNCQTVHQKEEPEDAVGGPFDTEQEALDWKDDHCGTCEEEPPENYDWYVTGRECPNEDAHFDYYNCEIIASDTVPNYKIAGPYNDRQDAEDWKADNCGDCEPSAPCECPCDDQENWDKLVAGEIEECGGLAGEYAGSNDLVSPIDGTTQIFYWEMEAADECWEAKYDNNPLQAQDGDPCRWHTGSVWWRMWVKEDGNWVVSHGWVEDPFPSNSHLWLATPQDQPCYWVYVFWERDGIRKWTGNTPEATYEDSSGTFPEDGSWALKTTITKTAPCDCPCESQENWDKLASGEIEECGGLVGEYAGGNDLVSPMDGATQIFYWEMNQEADEYVEAKYDNNPLQAYVGNPCYWETDSVWMRVWVKSDGNWEPDGGWEETSSFSFTELWLNSEQCRWEYYFMPLPGAIPKSKGTTPARTYEDSEGTFPEASSWALKTTMTEAT